ncbi:hypothetical protein [Streptomyces sp. MST-110588]|uniref:glycan biosynthesis hexose transferase WsfD n=1 Tax=Streptomyces sp. MST-110588 TaxID=2833628 RepID=UPI001F5CA01D|nr:hypothetical protein [Streptomyces sp. MST-110588]UNO41734.1 hypothetical protein KGS77_22035 [Streptomyces sp. MST-110588]
MTETAPPATAARTPWYARGADLSPRSTAALGLAVFTAALALFLLRFLVPVPVGSANQGDGARATCTLGLMPTTHGLPRFKSYVFSELRPAPAHCGTRVVPYWTSQTLLFGLGRPFTRLFGLRGEINLFAVGLVACLVAAVCLAVLAAALRLAVAARVAVAAAVWLIVADAAYFDYFASPLSETAGLLGILLVCTGIPLLGRGPVAGIPGLVAVAGGGMLATGAKTQLLGLAVPVVAVLLLRTVRLPGFRTGPNAATGPSAATGPGAATGPDDTAGPDGSPGRTASRPARLLLPRLLGAAAALAVLVVSAHGYAAQRSDSAYLNMNGVDTVFAGIVDGKHDTAADLKALGLPQEWSRYAGHTYWTHGQAVSRDPKFRAYRGELGIRNIARYYFHHPGRTVEILQLRARQLLAMRPGYLGNYPPVAHRPPGAQEHRVTLASSAGLRLRKAGLLLLVPLWALAARAGLRAVRRRRTHLERSLGAMALFLLATAVSQYLTAALAEAMENEKHMAFASFATLLLLPVLFASALAGRASPADRGPSRTR